MKRIIKLTENDLKRLIKNVLKEEIDTGQVSSWTERGTHIPRQRNDIDKEIRKLRQKIGEYEEEGKDTSELTKRIGYLKKQNGYEPVDESRGKSKIGSAVRTVLNKKLNEIRGWSLEPDDFIIIDGRIDPNKTYELIKISVSGGFFRPYVVEYDDYFPAMLNKIKEQETGDGYNEMFVSMADYQREVEDMMKEDNVDEETAESYLLDTYVPCYDYDFVVYAPYGISNSEPMSGAEMQKNIDATAEDNWLKH